MIIFNFAAVIIAAISVGIGLLLNAIFPTLFDGQYSGLTIGLIGTVVGGAGDLVGIRGRLFFIPIWIIGLLMMMFTGHSLWGIWGILAPLALLVVGLWWLVKLARKMEANRWAKAGPALSNLKSYPADGEPKQFWRLVSESLFLPTVEDFSSEIRLHNLEVAQIVDARESNQMPPEEFATWAGFTAFLEQSEQQDHRKPLDASLRNQIQQSIRQRLAK
jgi:hypothetical protein